MAAETSPSDDLAKLNHFPDDLNHRDLRSRNHATNRHRKQSQKYYGYRGVDPSWTGQPYYHTDFSSSSHSAAPSSRIDLIGLTAAAVTEIALSEVNSTKLPTSRNSPTLARLAETLELPPDQILRVRTSKWTPRDTYEQCQSGIWPLDRRHHHGKRIREKKAHKWSLEELGRREKQRAARVRSAVAEDEGADEVRQRRNIGENLRQDHQEDDGVATMVPDVHQEVEAAGLGVASGRAESVLSLQDYEVVTDPGSEVGDGETWEVLSAWSC